MNGRTLFVAATVFLTVSQVTVASTDRVALLIGNQRYAERPLNSPETDVSRLDSVLRSDGLGFDTITVTNADVVAMDAGIDRFIDALEPGVIGLFYYSGHGSQVSTEDGTTNYLIPIGGENATRSNAHRRLVSAQRVLARMEAKHPRLSLMILDACRDDAIGKGAGGGKGMVRMIPQGDTVIAYAAEPGRIANDGDLGAPSPFTEKLLQWLPQPGLEVKSMLETVGREVRVATLGYQTPQTPWIEGPALSEAVYLAGTLTQPTSLVVRTTPIGATVWVDDLQVGTTPWRDGAMAPGVHEVRVELVGYEPFSAEVDIERGETESLNVALARTPVAAAPTTGLLSLTTGATNAAIRIDGAYAGRGSLVDYPLSPGAHEVEAAEGNARASERFRIVAGESLELALTLVRPAPIEEPAATTLEPRDEEDLLPPDDSDDVAVSGSDDDTLLVRTFKDCELCPDMIQLRGGRLRMGDVHGTGDPDESPVVNVNVAPFAISDTEVTVMMWQMCEVAGQCPEQDLAGNPSPHHPVTSVSFEDAQRYVQWLSAQAGRTYRLPTEAEWEFSARGLRDVDFPWGDEIGQDRAVCMGCGETPTGPTWVKRYPPNQFGLYDLAGNAWEWTQDCWNDNHRRRPSEGSARNGDCTRRVIKGGAWNTFPSSLRVSSREGYRSDLRSASGGLRVATGDLSESSAQSSAGMVSDTH